MGVALEIVNSYVTNPGVGPAVVATTPFPGDVLAVRNFNNPDTCSLLDMWAQTTTAGLARVRSPRLHDNVQGIRERTIAATNRVLTSPFATQPLYAQDVLIAEMFGGAAETDGMAWINYYSNLPGVAAQLFTWAQIQPRILDLLTVEVQMAGGAAVGAYSVPLAINSFTDLLEANSSYAILGYDTDVVGLSVGIRGPDTGNLRVGGPMTPERLETRDWFVRLSNVYGIGAIPVINSANKGATLVDNAQTVAGVASNTVFQLALLHP
jgi:hypothetical protein